MPPATEASNPASGSAPPRRIDGLRVIALFKFVKALLLILTGYGVHKLLDPELFEKIRTWSATLTDRVDQRLVLRALTWVEGLGPDRLHLVLAITVASTAVVLTEGVGLWLRQRWAEWITVVATTCFIPFELWELIMRPPGRRLTVAITLVLNLLIALYLANRLRLAHARERQRL
jgi:uncharacterized membrane protein (DUF2068 family)